MILAQDGQGMLTQNQNGCPTCRKPIAEGVWFCPNCGEIITKDQQQLERLKQIQKRIKFNQEDLRATMAQLKDKLAPDEFIYYLFYHNGIFSNKYYAATDKKMIKFDYNQYWQTLYSEIVGACEPYHNGAEYVFDLRTYSETVKFTFGDSCSGAWDFYRASEQAFNDYTYQRKDKGALICSLKIP